MIHSHMHNKILTEREREIHKLLNYSHGLKTIYIQIGGERERLYVGVIALSNGIQTHSHPPRESERDTQTIELFSWA